MITALPAAAIAIWFLLLSPLVLRQLATAVPVRDARAAIPLALVVVFSFMPLVFSVPRQDGTAVLEQGLTASNVVSVALTGATALYLAWRCAIDRRLLLLPFCMPYLPFTLALGCDAASALWSIVPSYTLYRTAEVAVFSLACIVAFDRSDIARRLPDFLAVVITAWLVVVSPTVAESVAQGIVFSAAKNNLMPLVGAALMMLCAVQRTPRRALYLALGFVGFVVAGSASSTGALLAAIVPAALIAANRPPVRLAGFVLAAATMGVFTVLMLGLSAFPTLLDAVSVILQKPAVELANATGRDTIWPVFLAATRDHVFGSGFSAADRFVQVLLPSGLPDDLGRDSLFIVSAHNMFLSAWAGTGVMGLGFAALVLGTALAWGLKLDRTGRRFVTAFMLMLIYNGMTTPGIFQDWTANTLVFVGVLAYARVGALQRRTLWRPVPAPMPRAASDVPQPA